MFYCSDEIGNSKLSWENKKYWQSSSLSIIWVFPNSDMRDSHFELDSLSFSSRIWNVGQGFADISTCFIAENLKWSLTGRRRGKKRWRQPGSEVELCASNRLKGKEKTNIQLLKNSYISCWKYMGKIIFSYKFLWYFI